MSSSVLTGNLIQLGKVERNGKKCPMMDGLGSLHFSTGVTTASENVGVQMSIQENIITRQTRDRIAGLYGISVFNFSKKFAVFHEKY